MARRSWFLLKANSWQHALNKPDELKGNKAFTATEQVWANSCSQKEPSCLQKPFSLLRCVDGGQNVSRRLLKNDLSKGSPFFRFLVLCHMQGKVWWRSVCLAVRNLMKRAKPLLELLRRWMCPKADSICHICSLDRAYSSAAENSPQQMPDFPLIDYFLKTAVPSRFSKPLSLLHTSDYLS